MIRIVCNVIGWEEIELNVMGLNCDGMGIELDLIG